MSEHPVITIGFTCGDLRGSTIPLGSFSSPEGAILYALALGIPRDAVHVEAVTVSTPIYAEANAPGAERVRQARKALESFEAMLTRLVPLPGEALADALTRQLVAAQEDGSEFVALETKIEELEEKLRRANDENQELRDERSEIAEELEAVREAGLFTLSSAAVWVSARKLPEWIRARGVAPLYARPSTRAARLCGTFAPLDPGDPWALSMRAPTTLEVGHG